MISRFLPPDFDTRGPVVVMAGQGNYPAMVVAALREHSIPVRLIGFHEETDDSLVDAFPETERAVIKVGQLGKMLKNLRRLEARYVVMAGRITPRRLFRGLHPDLKAVAILTSLKEKNAETIFGAVAEEIRKIGVLQLDARVFLDNHVATPGLMARGKRRPDPHDLEHGIRIAKEIARLDIGQGVVVRKGTVLAVEAFEGTDAMLHRAGEFKTKEALFVKTVKPNQDYRFDVPMFGLRTLEVLQEAGISMAALEAENTIVLEKEKVVRDAERRGITLIGYQID
jgi:UDP-2,3-diacylglucosamine hydrolase